MSEKVNARPYDVVEDAKNVVVNCWNRFHLKAYADVKRMVDRRAPLTEVYEGIREANFILNAAIGKKEADVSPLRLRIFAIPVGEEYLVFCGEKFI